MFVNGVEFLLWQINLRIGVISWNFFYRNHCEFSTRAAFIEVVVPFDMKYFYALLIFNLKLISIFVFYVTLFSLFDGDETTIE